MGFFLSLNVALNCSIEQNLKQLLFLIVMPTKETTMAQLFIYNLREWRFCFHSTFKFFCTPAIYDWLYDAIFFSLFWRYFKKRRDNSFFFNSWRNLSFLRTVSLSRYWFSLSFTSLLLLVIGFIIRLYFTLLKMVGVKTIDLIFCYSFPTHIRFLYNLFLIYLLF